MTKWEQPWVVNTFSWSFYSAVAIAPAKPGTDSAGRGRARAGLGTGAARPSEVQGQASLCPVHFSKAQTLLVGCLLTEGPSWPGACGGHMPLVSLGEAPRVA